MLFLVSAIPTFFQLLRVNRYHNWVQIELLKTPCFETRLRMGDTAWRKISTPLGAQLPIIGLKPR